MKKVIAVIIYTIIIVNLVAGVVFFYKPPMQQQNNQASNQTNTTGSNSSGTVPNIPVNNSMEKISLADLATHNAKSDCWIAYKGKVYDVTDWLPDHPGSADAIAPYCGKAKEFEDAFTGQHGTSQVEKLMEEATYKGELEE